MPFWPVNSQKGTFTFYSALSKLWVFSHIIHLSCGFTAKFFRVTILSAKCCGITAMQEKMILQKRGENRMRFENQIALVVGSACGMGRETVLKLVR